MDWQSIETAPTDGTRILLYRDGYAENMAVCWRDNYLNQWRPVHGGTFQNPTAWMPLQPPTQKVTT